MKLGSGVRRACGGFVVAVACATGAAALAGGGGAMPRAGLGPVAVDAATPTPSGCLIPGLPLLCPTPTPTAPPGSTQHPAPSGQPAPSGKPGSSPPPTLSVVGNGRSVVIPLPTVAAAPAAATPTFAPGSPDLAVQSIVLASLTGDTVNAGASFPVQATCMAARGADTYAVANAKVAFTASGPAGSSPSVAPASAACDATGQTTVSVTAGAGAGDLAITATSGTARGTLTVHVTAVAGSPTTTSTASPSPAAAAGSTVSTSGTVPPARAPAIAGLFALAVAVLVTTLLRGPMRRMARAPVADAAGARGGRR